MQTVLEEEAKVPASEQSEPLDGADSGDNKGIGDADEGEGEGSGEQEVDAAAASTITNLRSMCVCVCVCVVHVLHLCNKCRRCTPGVFYQHCPCLNVQKSLRASCTNFMH